MNFLFRQKEREINETISNMLALQKQKEIKKKISKFIQDEYK